MSNPIDFELINGLSTSEVNDRINKYGYNEIPAAVKRTFFHILWEIVKEPMFILLISCGLIYFIIGDTQEALMLSSFVIVVIGITIYQERKSQKALQALRNLSSPRALVIRNGIQKRIAGREVVRDDIILLSEGDRVPADARLLSVTNLYVDESLLTGESVPVRKLKSTDEKYSSKNIGDNQYIVFSGTMVIKGHAIGQVSAIGVETELGKIGKSLQTFQSEDTFIQKQTAKIIKNFAYIGLALCVLLVIVYGLTIRDWIHGLIAGITMAMATLPEEFPVVLTIFLALGAWRISQKKVLARRVPAVEMLGATTVLCVDKTGTLTMNQMAVTKISVNDTIYEVTQEQSSLPEDLHKIVEASILASPADPFDPMEKAMKELGIRTLINTEHLHHDWGFLHEYPLSDNLLAMSRAWKSANDESFIIAAKGAPEAIADLCHLNSEKLQKLKKQINQMADYGLRIIGIAQAKFPVTKLPVKQHDFEFDFLGLLGLVDPVRPGVKEAIQECYSAGIRVIMITGDYPGTALNIGRQIGLNPTAQIITGTELDALTDDELRNRIKTTSIFARVIPEQKLRIVNALKANQEVVAMTGDGVNDAPALKSAHIGISMGERGTDVAREASSMVLLDDNFASIVAAIRMGRRIYDNLKKAISYIFAVHIPIAGMSLLPVLFKLPLALLPVHIVFLELIIDPACSIVFEMERTEQNIMQRKPRNLNESLFNRQMILVGLLQGLSILTIVLIIYVISLQLSFAVEQARTFAFVNLVIGNLGLILSNRSQSHSLLTTLNKPNKSLWFIICGALIVLISTLLVPFLQNLFKLSRIDLSQALFCLISSLLAIMIAEIVKILYVTSTLKK